MDCEKHSPIKKRVGARAPAQSQGGSQVILVDWSDHGEGEEASVVIGAVRVRPGLTVMQRPAGGIIIIIIIVIIIIIIIIVITIIAKRAMWRPLGVTVGLVPLILVRL